MKVVGRKKEIAQIERCLHADKSHFIAVYGRRRVGKTFLVKSYFKNQFSFYSTGLAHADLHTQLTSFSLNLLDPSGSETDHLPRTWLEAFGLLIKKLSKSKKKKKVVFLDELPWMDSRNSGFLTALEHFWNSWASGRTDILLIVCGSAASWMINKLIKAKGGLHNRVTLRIKIQPFTLSETKTFLISRKHKLDDYQIVQIYMALGGIPFYLEQLETDLSATQNIDLLCFSDEGILREEYSILFQSLFDSSDRHVSIVEALASKKKGLTRKELTSITKMSNAGSFTRILTELEQSNFIRKYSKYGNKSRESLYQLVDNYSLFFNKWIKDHTSHQENYWTNLINTPQYYAWAGFAYEMVCLQHLPQIKGALGISGIQTDISSWNSDAAQIDLIIDRKDQVINLVEAKFSINEYEITKSYAKSISNKIDQFIKNTKTKKAIWFVLLTTYGLKKNAHSGHVQKTLTMSDLFI